MSDGVIQKLMIALAVLFAAGTAAVLLVLRFFL
jgi:hypothetical protein